MLPNTKATDYIAHFKIRLAVHLVGENCDHLENTRFHLYFRIYNKLATLNFLSTTSVILNEVLKKYTVLV